MEKLLVMSNFSFSHSVFKTPVQQIHKNQGLFGKGLNLAQVIVFSYEKEENIVEKKKILFTNMFRFSTNVFKKLLTQGH